jgi:hypothetical protein
MTSIKTSAFCFLLTLTRFAFSAAPSNDVVTWTPLEATSGAIGIDPDFPNGKYEPCNDGSGGALFYEYFGNCHANVSAALLHPLGGAQKNHDGAIRTKMVCDDISYTTSGFPPYLSGYIVNHWSFGIGVVDPITATIGIDLRLYANDGSHGMPGTLLWGYGFLHQLHQKDGDYFGLIGLLSPTLMPPILTLRPGPATLWACLQFQNMGDDSVGVDFMNTLSVLRYDGWPESGSSSDQLFETQAGDDFSCQPSPRGTELTGASGDSFHLHFIFDDPRNWGGDELWRDDFDRSLGCGYSYRPDGS